MPRTSSSTRTSSSSRSRSGGSTRGRKTTSTRGRTSATRASRSGSRTPTRAKSTGTRRTSSRTTARTSSRAGTGEEGASSESLVTTDHEFIRRWAEERGAQPSCVRGTGGAEDIGMLRLDFPGYTGEESLEPISWQDWFRKFDERELAFLYQETTASGEQSNFNKLVNRTGKSGKSRAPRRR